MRIALHNIGPIRDADVDLSALTVLVGPNGSGKTIFSSVVYAATLASNDALRRVSVSIPIASSNEDLPEDFVRRLIDRWEDDFRKAFERELRRCAARDLDKLGRERRGGHGAAPRITITDGPQSSPTWRLVFRLQKGKLVIERTNPSYLRPRLEVEELEVGNRRRILERVFRALRRTTPTRALYFPASRSGFMQTYGALTSLVWGALGAGYFEQATIGSIPGTAADFLQFLAQLKPETESAVGGPVANDIEEQLLEGKLLLVQGEGSPQVMFHPTELSQSWSIEESATSTAEIAPLALYLRHQARQSDAILIDEPEAHLHPASQVALASCLAAVGNALQHVIIATHSEFLVGELSNLTMETQLTLMDDGTARPRSLRVFEFSKTSGQHGTTVSPLNVDPERGFEVDQFSQVADRTYQRSIELFNRLHS
jgi:predicted ATPase